MTANPAGGQQPTSRADLEEAVADAWAEVFQRSDLARDVSLFALGGESVQIAGVARLLRAAVDPSLPLRALFMAPTIQGMAAAIEQFQLEAAVRQPVLGSTLPRESGTL